MWLSYIFKTTCCVFYEGSVTHISVKVTYTCIHYMYVIYKMKYHVCMPVVKSDTVGMGYLRVSEYLSYCGLYRIGCNIIGINTTTLRAIL
jgi:hypothetical protein